jgi:hypothetical protein
MLELRVDPTRLDRDPRTWQDETHGHPSFFESLDNSEECQVAVPIASRSHDRTTKDLVVLKSQVQEA